MPSLNRAISKRRKHSVNHIFSSSVRTDIRRPFDGLDASRYCLVRSRHTGTGLITDGSVELALR